jgi:hypothetical protein
LTLLAAQIEALWWHASRPLCMVNQLIFSERHRGTTKQNFHPKKLSDLLGTSMSVLIPGIIVLLRALLELFKNRPNSLWENSAWDFRYIHDNYPNNYDTIEDIS